MTNRHPLKPRRAQVFGREVQFSKLSAAKVRPEYKPTFHEEYHSREAAEFAAEYYEEYGKVLLHREARRILAKKKPTARLSKPSKPATTVRRRQEQLEIRL
jgi:hypothetical protein